MPDDVGERRPALIAVQAPPAHKGVGGPYMFPMTWMNCSVPAGCRFLMRPKIAP